MQEKRFQGTCVAKCFLTLKMIGVERFVGEFDG